MGPFAREERVGLGGGFGRQAWQRHCVALTEGRGAGSGASSAHVEYDGLGGVRG